MTKPADIIDMIPYKQLSDSDLLCLMTKDQEQAFSELFSRYWDKLLQTAIHKIDDVMEAENIVQDVFVSLWKRRKELNITGSFQHYLLVAVKYRLKKVLHDQRVRRVDVEQGCNSVDLLDASTRQYLDFVELQVRLEQHGGKLTEKARLIYRMNKE